MLSVFKARAEALKPIHTGQGMPGAFLSNIELFNKSLERLRARLHIEDVSLNEDTLIKLDLWITHLEFTRRDLLELLG